MAAVEQVPVSRFKEWAERAIRKGIGDDFRTPLRQVKVLLVAETRRNFAGAHDPEGRPWAPLKRSRRKRKGQRPGKDKPLRDTGILMASVTTGGAGHEEELTKTRLLFGTNVSYASYHQYGTRTIPARPFLGWSKRIKERVDKIFARWLRKRLAGGTGEGGGE